jgi:hypothetical protein
MIQYMFMLDAGVYHEEVRADPQYLPRVGDYIEIRRYNQFDAQKPSKLPARIGGRVISVEHVEGDGMSGGKPDKVVIHVDLSPRYVP